MGAPAAPVHGERDRDRRGVPTRQRQSSRWRRRRRARDRTHGFTDRGRSILLAGALLALGGLLLGFPDLTRVGLAAAAMTGLAGLISWRHRPQLEVARTLSPAPLVSGHGGRILVRVRNVGARGTDALAAAELLSPWLGSPARMVVPPLRPGAQTTTSYDVRPTRRGRHRAGPFTVVSRDALGLTHRAAVVGEPLDVLVLPPVHDLSAGDPTGLGLGHEGDAPANVLTGTEHDVSVREYRQGDDLRRVHWGVTAHRGRLMVRHEALPRLRRAVLVLDASAAVWQAPADGSAQDDRTLPGFEWAVEALASVAAHLNSMDFALHLLLAGARPGTGAVTDPARPSSLDEVLVRLAIVEPGRTTVDGPAAPARSSGPTQTSRSGAPSPQDDTAAQEGPAAPRLAPPWSVGAAAREVAGAGGVLVLATGDGVVGSAHETFSLLRTGLTGLAMVVDTAAFAAGSSGPSDRRAGPLGPASAGLADAAGLEAGVDARRLCAHARSGGWRAVAVGPWMSPATAWATLLGTTRAWTAPVTGDHAGQPTLEVR